MWHDTKTKKIQVSMWQLNMGCLLWALEAVVWVMKALVKNAR